MKHLSRPDLCLVACSMLLLFVATFAQPSATFSPPRWLWSSQEQTGPVRGMTGSDIIARAKTWVDASVGYSEDPPYYPDAIHGYRRDCSGFVSMAWLLPAHGLTTYTLPSVAYPISKDALQPGDVLNNRDGGGNPKLAHVVIFAGWADTAHMKYKAYEEAFGLGAHYTPEMPYPYWS